MQSIKVKDKTYSFCWGLLALMNTCDKLGCTVSELTSAVFSDTDKHFTTLAYNALIANELTLNNGIGVINKGQDGYELEGFNFFQFLDWLNNQPEEVGKEISDSYLDSIYMGKSMRDRYEELAEKIRVDLSEELAEQSPAKKKNVRSVK